MIEQILPDDVATAWAFGQPRPPEKIYPEERALVACAVEKRRREFAAGRACAHRAMAQLGVEPTPVLVGPNREPLWPDSLVGSITHCEGYVAAAVAPRSSLFTIGIDAEPNEPLADEVLALVASGPEARMIAEQLDRRPDLRWDRLLFSAKEAVYKAWFPVMKQWLDFDQAEIEFGDGSFVAHLVGPELVEGERRHHSLTGRWALGKGILTTSVWVGSG